LAAVAAVGDARTCGAATFADGATLHMGAREMMGLPSAMEAERMAAAMAVAEVVVFILAGLWRLFRNCERKYLKVIESVI
jgi:hypothetical protein